MKSIKSWYTKQPKWMQITLVVVVILIAVIVIKKIAKMIDRPSSVDYDANNIPVAGGDGYTNANGQPISWNPDPLAKELYDNICSGYNFFTYPETTDKVNDLPNDDMVRLLYNHCLEYYQFDPIKCLESEWTDWGGSYGRALSRFKRATGQ